MRPLSVVSPCRLRRQCARQLPPRHDATKSLDFCHWLTSRQKGSRLRMRKLRIGAHPVGAGIGAPGHSSVAELAEYAPIEREPIGLRAIGSRLAIAPMEHGGCRSSIGARDTVA